MVAVLALLSRKVADILFRNTALFPRPVDWDCWFPECGAQLRF